MLNFLPAQKVLKRVSVWTSGECGSPLLDWIDIHLRVPAVPYAELGAEAAGEPSAAIRSRVEAARVRQRERFRSRTGMHANADMGSREVRRYCRQSPEVAEILAPRSSDSASRHAAVTGCSSWRGRSQTWRLSRGSNRCRCGRRFSTGRWIGCPDRRLPAE